MNKSRANILQIQKYLNGELDAKAMHQLEREAQDDPFLMDALEGYQITPGNQQPNLDILADRLNARVNPKVRRMIPWTTISIAAGIVGFMIVVGLLYNNSDPAKPLQTAEVTEQPKTQADTVSTPTIIQQYKSDVAVLQPSKKRRARLETEPPAEAVTENEVALQDDKAITAPAFNSDLKEVAVMPAPKSTGTPLDEMVIGAIVRQKDTGEMPLTVAIAKRPISQPLKGKVDGVTTSEPKRPTNEFELHKLDLPAGYLARISNNVIPRPDDKGKIDVKSPPVSSSSGYLAVPAGAETMQSGLVSSQSGIVSNLSNGLQLNTNVTLNNDSTADYSKPGNVSTSALAHPQKGWVMYQLYLAQKCTLPVGQQAGVVELKFTVSPIGDISNITVVKGLSPMANKKAVQLIADGPKWVGNANGKPEEKTLQLEFIIK